MLVKVCGNASNTNVSSAVSNGRVTILSAAIIAEVAKIYTNVCAGLSNCNWLVGKRCAKAPKVLAWFV